jgi:tetratricopeptide (TPR) repeat protein
MRRYEEAIVSYEEAIKHKPDYHEAWHNRGVALGNMRRYEEAIVSYEEALKYKPNNTMYKWGLALCKILRSLVSTWSNLVSLFTQGHKQ